MQGADESEVLLSTDRLHPDRTQSGVNHAEVMHIVFVDTANLTIAVISLTAHRVLVF